MQNSPADNLIFLKDVPAPWNAPTFVKTEGALGVLSIEIYFSIMFGQDIPSRVFPYLTRGSQKTSSNRVAYFVGVFKLNPPYNTFAYPPSGTNQVDPISLITGSLQHVQYIDKALFDLPLSAYKSQAPQNLIDYFLLLGGKWNLT